MEIIKFNNEVWVKTLDYGVTIKFMYMYAMYYGSNASLKCLCMASFGENATYNSKGAIVTYFSI